MSAPTKSPDRIFAEKLLTSTFLQSATDARFLMADGERQDIPALMSAVVDALVAKPALLRALAAEGDAAGDQGLPLSALFDNQPLPPASEMAPAELVPDLQPGQTVTGVLASTLPIGSVVRWEMDDHASGMRRHTMAHGWLPSLADTATYRIVQVGPAAALVSEVAA